MSTSSESKPQPPLPVSTELTAFFWQGLREHRLLILRCLRCRHFVHYPRPICEICQSSELTPFQVSGYGVIYSYTEVIQAFHPYFVEQAPYVLAIVELEEQLGLKLTTNIVGSRAEDLRVGLEVEVCYQDISSALTLPYFQRRSSADRSEPMHATP